MRECRKPCRGVLIQPGAESQEIFDYLKEQGIPYLQGCALVGLRLYPKKEKKER